MMLSTTDVTYELQNLRTNLFLDETEDTWEKIGKAISALKKICDNGGYDANSSEIVAALRSAHRPIVNAMNSERTRLSLIPLELFNSLASVMGTDFEQLFPLFMQPILTLCTRTNKVVLNRARACIFSIIEGCQSAALLTYFLQNIKDKSNTLKVVASEGTLACLNSCNPPDLEKESRATEIEAIIRATARDAHPDVRKISRKLFESYQILLPTRVSNFTAPLSPTTRKYLDIKAAPLLCKTASSARSADPPRAPIKQELKTSKPSNSTSTTSTRHAPSRSVSSAVSSTTINKAPQQTAVPLTRVKRQESVVVPLASYAPVRAAKVVTEAQNSSGTQTVPTAARLASGPMRATTYQEAKRPLPSQRGTTALVRTTSVVPSTSAHRVQLKTTATVPETSVTQAGFTGPRRVPMPPPATAPAPGSSKEKEGQKVLPAKLRNATTSKPRSALVPAAPTKSKVPAKDRLPSTQASESRSRPPSTTRSAVSSTNTTAANAASVRPLAVPKAKPQWGRPAALAKPPAGAQKSAPATALARKPSTRILPRVAVPLRKRPVTPAMVALPPSPTPGANVEPSGSSMEEVSETEKQPQTQKDEDDQVISLGHQEATSEQIVQEEPILQNTENANFAATESELEQCGEVDKDGRVSASEENIISDDYAPAVSSAPVTTPQTPQTLLPLPVSETVYAAKTPISALLSSIERGFTYSPTTPVSPAELYLPNINGGTPYVHQSHSNTHEPRQPFNYALHAPDANGMFTGFEYDHKTEEDLVCGEIGVIRVSDHNKLFAHIGMDDMRHALSQINQ